MMIILAHGGDLAQYIGVWNSNAGHGRFFGAGQRLAAYFVVDCVEGNVVRTSGIVRAISMGVLAIQGESKR